MDEYDQWDKLSVISAEIREAIEQDFSEDSLQALRNKFFDETEILKRILGRK